MHVTTAYARCANLAYTLCANQPLTPAEAWQQAAAEVFPHSKPARIKSCPKNAFLGLAAAGHMRGIAPFAHRSKNGAYACRAAQLLLALKPDTPLPDAKTLWLAVMHDIGETDKQPNSQMDVALALYRMGVMVQTV
jgi:hypothetical protein